MQVNRDDKMHTNVVRKDGGEWCIFSKSGKRLECKPTKEAADERLRQIEYFKREGNMLRVNVKTKVNNAEIRRETRNGREVIVVPSATLPDNVVMNNIMYPAEEIEKSYLSLNRKPAPLGHPKIGDMYVSAQEPEAINEYWVGAWNENVRRENGRVYLDKVIDVNRAKECEKGRKLLEAINKQEPIHTSTGLILTPKPVQNCDEYKALATNMQFDHDAILLDEPGAATPEQGVGMMVNSAGDQIEVQNVEVNMSDMTEDAQESVDYAAMHLARAIERADSVSRFDAMKDRIIGAVRSVMGGKSEEDAMSVNHDEDSEMPITEEKFNELAEQVKQLASNQLTKDDLKPINDTIEQLQANAQEQEEQRKAALVATVVNSGLLEEEDAKELNINALTKLAQKSQPGGVHNVFGGPPQTNADEAKISNKLPE